MKAGNKILGLAVGQKSFLVAEVVGKGDRHAVSHCAEFVFPEGLSLSTPEKLGDAFKQFLRTHQISTRDIVIGLPAKRLVTRRKDVPPASMAVAASTLRLQAEGEFSSELDNLVMDFAGTPSAAESTTVLLIATNKVVVDECAAMALAAGLRLYAITSTTAALGRATSRLPGGDGLVLSIGPNGAELVVQHGSDPAHLKHLNVISGAESMNALAGEIRRMMASIPRNGTPQTMALWNAGVADNPQSVLEQRLAMPVTTPEVSSLVLTETANTEGYAPAVSLALAAMENDGLPVDFLHSRLAPPKAPAMSNAKKLAIAGGLILAAIAAFVFFDLSSKQDEINKLQKSIAGNIKSVKTASEWVTRDDYAKKWLPKGPLNIEVLRDVTQMFPAQGNTIWATSLANNRDTWELDGKSVNQEYPQNILDRMIEHPDRFTNPKINDLQYEQASGYWNFRMQFTYTPPEVSASQAAAQAAQAAAAATQITRGGTGRTPGQGGQGNQGQGNQGQGGQGRGGRGGGGGGGAGAGTGAGG